MIILDLLAGTSRVVGIVNGYRTYNFTPPKNNINYGLLAVSSFIVFTSLLSSNNTMLRRTGETMVGTTIVVGVTFCLGTFIGRAIKYLQL